ncbi:PREDICTED: dachshund homolog 2 [Pygoscelis adeliae]|uniref:dachshund homolog 2 n=1 Tax=Pygoscelis adeliae TaxID=9238 RepID=UPI0004F50243|nr:PREDICTED: dachshund homolog 2 [Pygoscelis adeliae]
MIRKMMLEQQIPAIHKGGSVIDHGERKCRGAFGALIIGTCSLELVNKHVEGLRGKTSLGTLELALVEHAASKQDLKTSLPCPAAQPLVCHHAGQGKDGEITFPQRCRHLCQRAQLCPAEGLLWSRREPAGTSRVQHGAAPDRSSQRPLQPPRYPNLDISRPGRPPKRSLGVAIQENARLLPHGVPGLLSPGLISPTGLTAAAMAEAMKLQKMKLMAMNSLHGSGSQNGTESENEELNSNAGGSESSWDKDKLQSPITTGSQHSIGHPTLSGQSSLGSAHPLSPLQQNHLLTNRIDLPFMMMPHPLLPVSLPPASVAMAMNQMNHLNTIANMAAAAQMHSPLSRAGASVIKERIQDSPSPAPSLEDSQRPGSHASSHQSSSVSSSPSQLDNTPDRIGMLTNSREGELIDQETGTSLKKIQKEKEEVQIAIPIMKPTLDKVQLAGQALPPGFPAPFLFADGLSSVETLLTNIQGLLKVAVDNARVQEKQIQQEKKELKMELCRERELRESLERQLTAELQSRATIQKRLKKEKKAKRKLQEALEFESKRREQVEQALKQATSGDGLRMLNDAGIPDMEIEHNGTQHDSAAMQENRTYIKPTIMY